MRSLAVRIVIAITALAGALLLLQPGGTGAEFFKTAAAAPGSVGAATVSMTNGSGTSSGTSATTIMVDPLTGFGYSAVDLSLVNTGNNRTLAFTVDGVSVADVSRTGFAGNLSIVWALAGSATACSTVVYTGTNVVWTSTTVSMTGSTPAALSTAAQSIPVSSSAELCARYQVGAATSTSGDQIAVTYTFLGWNSPVGSFTTTPVTWKQNVSVFLAAPVAGTPAPCTYGGSTVTIAFTWSGTGTVKFVGTTTGPSSPSSTVNASPVSLNLGITALGGSWTVSTVAVQGNVKSVPMVVRVDVALLGLSATCTTLP